MIKLLLNEIWKIIPNTIGYEVSNRGRVKSPKHITCQNKIVGGNILSTTSLNSYGYPRVSIKFINIGFKDISIHRLVAEAFIPNPNNYTEINHKDENKLNNDVDNLEWCTKEYNNNYGDRTEKSRLSQINIYTVYDKNTKTCIYKKFLGVKDIANYFNINVPDIYRKKFRNRYTIVNLGKYKN